VSGAATWTLSGFGDEIDADPVVQCAVLRALGARHLEVRSAWGVNVVDFTPELIERLRGVLDAAGMGVSAIASPIGKVDVELDIELEVARLRKVIAVAAALGTPFIRVFSFYRSETATAESVRDLVIENMAVLAAVARDAGVVLLHENEKHIYGDTPERVLDLVESVGSPALRVAWDSANFVQVGVEHPHDAGYALLRQYIDYLQVKDAVYDGGGVVPAGHGDGQVEKTILALKADGYSGFVSLEPHLEVAGLMGGFSGPESFGVAARALAVILAKAGISTD
jgi:sugar phosphate isomerase/epimerase